MTSTMTFDVENRLTEIVETTANPDEETLFYYDAEGNRILSVQPDGTKVYTPFSEYEESITSGGASTQRRHYTLAGHHIATRVISGSGDGTLTYAFNDHLGSVGAWSNSSGTYIANSTSRYEPYGGYRTKPVAAVNPDISDRGYTGHRQNNTGTYDLGLIYMNARYYLPEIGRFVSADTIVPEPKTPQSFNRYSYVRNSPTNGTDPTGHLECIDLECETVWNHSNTHAIMHGSVPPAISYIHHEMVTNAQSEVADLIRFGNQANRYLPGIGKSFAYGAWTSQVMDADVRTYLGVLAPYFANWDHKPILKGEFGPSPVPEIERTGWATVGAALYRYDIWSNAHYGFAGAAAGFSDLELINGAGLEQVGTNISNGYRPTSNSSAPTWLSSWDQASDTSSIQLGASLWACYGLTVTPGDLHVALTLEGWYGETEAVQSAP